MCQERERIKLTGDVQPCSPPPNTDARIACLDPMMTWMSLRGLRNDRIERLTESHLQGQPLFILSASLLGLFDPGWRRIQCPSPTPLSMLFPLAVSQHVLHETDPYPRRRLQPNSVCRIDLNPVCATPASVCKRYRDKNRWDSHATGAG